jgi:hypothetical protein
MNDPTADEFYPSSATPGDCGTFLATGGTLYAPDFASHAGTATAPLGPYTPFTPVSQTPVSGLGTVASPFTVTTTVNVGATGLEIQETTTYVIGDDTYDTNTTVINHAGDNSLVLYRAGDCYLGASDSGYGALAITAPGSVACTKTPNNSPANRFEEFIPVTGGSQYYEDFYANVWSWIGSQTPFPNTCACLTNLDNGAGLSWHLFLPAGGSVSVLSKLRFSVPPPMPYHITIHRFPPSGTVVLLAAPTTFGWSCVDVHSGLAVSVGSVLVKPNPGVSCTPPANVGQTCIYLDAGGYHAHPGLGTLNVTSSCGAFSVTETLSLPFGDPGFSTSLTGSGPVPWNCTVDESGLIIPPEPDYWVFCDVHVT